MLRLLLGLALLPTAAISLFVALKALALVASTPSSGPFIGGLAASGGVWLLGRYALVRDSGPLALAGALSRRLYVVGHELTHALAAWAMGGKVYGFHVGEDGGHVDLSESNFIIALAPYFVPIHAFGVMLAYRAWTWWKPAAPGYGWFLAALGAALAFHALLTFECLWDRKQPDLQAAGGRVFSISLIGLANALMLVLMLKALFPKTVDVTAAVRETASWSGGFWSGAGKATGRAVEPLKAQLPKAAL